MTRVSTVDDLVDQVRSQIDEDNIDSIDTDVDILPALNRAQDFAFNILARHYEEPLLSTTTLELFAGTSEYPMPENAFEDRLEKVEISIGGSQFEVQRISFRDLSFYETSLQVNVPYYYTVVGRKIRFVPEPTGTYNARIWYLREPVELGLTQGRITRVEADSNYVVVDAPGSALTTNSNLLRSYVNLVDGQTGEVKATLQIKSLSETRVTFRSSPNRTQVQGSTISSDLADLPGGVTVEPDDYLALAPTTCVPYFARPVSNFLIQYAVAELSRKTGESAESEERVLEKFEQQVERSWVGRESRTRVKKRSKNWDLPFRRWYYTQR